MIKNEEKPRLRQLHLNLCGYKNCKMHYLYSRPTENGYCLKHWNEKVKKNLVVK